MATTVKTIVAQKGDVIENHPKFGKVVHNGLITYDVFTLEKVKPYYERLKGTFGLHLEVFGKEYFVISHCLNFGLNATNTFFLSVQLDGNKWAYIRLQAINCSQVVFTPLLTKDSIKIEIVDNKSKVLKTLEEKDMLQVCYTTDEAITTPDLMHHVLANDFYPPSDKWFLKTKGMCLKNYHKTL